MTYDIKLRLSIKEMTLEYISISLLQFERIVVFFGEDPMDTSTDEFFGIFATFLQSFAVS